MEARPSVRDEVMASWTCYMRHDRVSRSLDAFLVVLGTVVEEEVVTIDHDR